jgi:alpha-beta hydrolase superfamily lysophospholipase
MNLKAFLLVPLLLNAVASVAVANSVPIGFSPKSVRAAMKPLVPDSSTEYPSSVQDYFNYYRLDFPRVLHSFGTYISASCTLGTDKFKTDTLAANVFKPTSPRGTMLVVHGYIDHSGIMRNVIRLGLDSGFTVAAIDLPGHGLSSGPRISIQDFSQYGRAIGNFLDQYGKSLPRPLILVGHSTGCAAIIEYLNIYKKDLNVDRVIFCAPLVHTTYWVWVRALNSFFGRTSCTSHRWHKKLSSDAEWLKWYYQEPLQEKRVPARWLSAMFAWNKRLESYELLSMPVCVIQGKKDNAVDWRYNIPALTRRFNSITIHYVDNGRHHLMNESEPVKSQVLGIIGGELSAGLQGWNGK